MTTLQDKDPELIKMFLIGDSGAGKTGALESLVSAGYTLYIVDLDNGLSPLAQHIKHNGSDLSKVHFVTLSDDYRGGDLRKATAYQRACKCLDKFGDEDIDPKNLGPDAVFVIDSLTLLGRSAFAQAKMQNPNSKDPRQWYFAAQQALENYLACVFGASFAVNVIVNSHITDIELNDGTRKGFPAAIGSALSRHVGKYCNDIFVAETKGIGSKARRVIRTVPNGQTDAKTSAVGLDVDLPLESALATIFSKLRH